MGNVSREMETLRNNLMEMIGEKTLTEIKNAFDELISRLGVTEERIKKLLR